MNNAALDLLVESAAVQGQLATGISPSLIAARSSFSSREITALACSNTMPQSIKSPKWNREEDKFLESCLGVLSDEDMAAVLGRSVFAVHLRWSRELGLPSPSKHPAYITANQIANGIHKDIHGVTRMIDRGMLQGHMLPSVRKIRLVHRTTLLCFMTNPMNWCYFNPDQVGLKPLARRRGKNYDEEFWAYARRLIMKRKTLWADAWWSIGRVALHRRVSIAAVNKAIREGRLPATDWGNWWVLKSHATDDSIRLQTWTGKGGKGQYHSDVSARAEGFLILGNAVGLMHSEIGAMMNWQGKRVAYYLHTYRVQGKIPQIIKEHGLKVYYDAKTGKTFADWKVYRDRFPCLARLMESTEERRFTREERKYFNRVKMKAEKWRKAV